MLESRLLELKAKVSSLSMIRMILLKLKACHVGTFQQCDTYYTIPKGRLKLREIKGAETAEFIYYERQNITGPKKSDAIILDIPNVEAFKLFCQRAFQIKSLIEKRREIYTYKGTQIHLDCVKNLGTFIEFEREITDYTKDRESIDELMQKLKIYKRDLIKGSYSDLLSLDFVTDVKTKKM